MSLPDDFCLACGNTGEVDWDEEGDLPYFVPCPECERGRARAKIAEQVIISATTRSLSLADAIKVAMGVKP